MSKPKKPLPRMAKFVDSCKICSLMKTHPDFYLEVHNRIMEEDQSKNSVMNWMNSQVDYYNAQLPEDCEEERLSKFNGVNLKNHFSKHVTKVDLLARDLRAVMRKDTGYTPPSETPRSALQKETAEAFMYEMTEELADYTSITRYVKILEDMLYRYEQETLNPPEQPGKKRRPISIRQINDFNKLLSDLTDMKLRLTKLRNSSHVAGSAVQRAVAMSVEMFTNSLVSITQEAAESFREANPDSTVGDAIIETLRMKMAESIKQSFKEIISEVFDEFSIK